MKLLAPWLLLGVIGGCASTPAAHSPRRAASSEAETVVQRQLDAYNARDLRSFAATYSQDVSVYRPPASAPVISGKQELTDFYRDTRFNLPTLHAELLHRSVVGNMVIDHERISGLRPGTVDAVAVYMVSDGLIQTVWIFSP